MSGLKSMLRSRKFWAAVGSLVFVVLTNVAGLDPKAATAISAAIVTLGTAYIIATGAEDSASKLKAGTAPPSRQVGTPEDETVDNP